MIATIATLILFRGPDLSKHVTYETVAVPVAKAIDGIAKATGQKLLASDEMSRDVVVLHLSDIPLSEALPRIAKATSGKWEDQAGTYVLVPDQTVRRNEEENSFQKRVKELAEGIKERLNGQGVMQGVAAEVAAAKTAAAQQASGDSGSPVVEVPPEMQSRAAMINAFLAALNPAELAAMREGGRIVFSSNPTASQKPLGGFRPELLAQFVKDHNAQVAKQKGQPSETVDGPASQASALAIAFGGDTSGTPKEIKGQPAKILLGACREMAVTGMVSLDLVFFDAEGRVTYSDRDFISSQSGVLAMAADALSGGKKNPKEASASKEPEGRQIEFSPVSKELAALFSGPDMFGGKVPDISAEAMEKLLHPDQFDPMSFFTSEALLAVAKDRGEQLVALVADTGFDQVGRGGGSKLGKNAMTTGQFVQTLKDPNSAVAVSETGGWFECKPKDPFQARDDRTDRAALTEFVQSSHSKGTASLDDFARLALRTRPISMEGPGMFYVAFAGGGGLMSSFAEAGSWEMLRLYGLLSGDQRQTLEHSGRLRIADLSPDENATLHRIVYGAHPDLSVTRPGDKPKPKLDIPFMDISPALGSSLTEFLQEPTESMPGGLPGDATISLAVSNQTIVSPAGKNIGIFKLLGPLGPSEYSLFSSMGDSPIGEMAEFIPKMDKFRLGSRKNLDFTFQFSDILAMKKTLRDDSMPKGGAIVAKADLPSDFLKMADSYKSIFKGMMDIPGMFGKGGTPPP